MANGMCWYGFDFFIASAREVPFGIPLNVQCIVYDVLLCVPFIFLSLLTEKNEIA